MCYQKEDKKVYMEYTRPDQQQKAGNTKNLTSSQVDIIHSKKTLREETSSPKNNLVQLIDYKEKNSLAFEQLSFHL